MSVYEKITDVSTSVFVAILTAIASGIFWLIRQIFTSKKQIEMLSREISHRDELRKLDRADISEVKDSVKRIEGWIMEKNK